MTFYKKELPVGPMKTSKIPFTDLFDQKEDRSYSVRLTVMVAITQITGLVLIYLGLKILKTLPEFHQYVRFWSVVLGVFLLVVWWIYCWYDEIWNAIKKSVNPNEDIYEPRAEAARKTAVIRATFGLIILDTILLIVLIMLTGGSAKSPLDALLPVIPIIAMILKQPRRQFIKNF